MQQRKVGRDLQRTHGRVVLGVEVAFVMNGDMARIALHLDAHGAQIDAPCRNELRQQLKRFSPGTQHRAYQVLAGLWV